MIEEGVDATASVDEAMLNQEMDSRQVEDNHIRLQRYQSEWCQLSAGLEEVRRLAITGALRTSRLHSIAWGILLGVLPQEKDRWLQTIRDNRKSYEDIRKRVICDPRNEQEPEDNPLSQNDESKWNQHFRDEELRSVIELDVIRSYPGMEFFKQPVIEEAMIKVLFCFARETPVLLYRQGMHEILAPLLFVLQSDHKAAEHTPLGPELLEIMDPAYIEHDSYSLFKAIMAGIEKFYRLNDLPTNKAAYLPVGVDKPANMPQKRNENEVVHHLALIRDNLLIPHDPELAEHLQNCDIALSLFGIRWLRVLFGREFHLHDLLILWDVIFAEGRDFDLAGYVMVSMLVAIRSLLINNETVVCLTHLMHYPSSIDIQYIIDYALYLKNPNLYSKPIARPMQQPVGTPFYDILKTIPKKVPQKTKAKVRKTGNQTLRVASKVEDGDVMEGFEEADLLRDELLNAHNLMSLCRVKLDQYEKIIRKSLPSNLPPSHPALQALLGIKELSLLLRRETSSESDVEPALEADEIANSQKSKKKIPANQQDTVRQHNSVVANTSTKHNSGKNQGVNNTKEVALVVIKEQVNSNGQVSGAPSPDPLRLRSD